VWYGVGMGWSQEWIFVGRGTTIASNLVIRT
jgi:hypothetical protein